MRKLALAVLFVALVGALAVAQSGTITGNIAYVPATDTMGAHENGGRGCAGCHAPHSGGRGSGGTVTGAGVSNPYGAGNLGDNGLWGTDTTVIQSVGSLTFDGTYTVSLAGTWNSTPIFKGVVTCLSCHDGNISKGAMMSGISYEQAWGLLNFASSTLRNAGPNGYASLTYPGVPGSLNPYPYGVTQPPPQNGWTPTLYGAQPIPTLLGNDGGTPGDYNNDHPVGPLANLGAALGAWLTNLTVVFNTANGNSVNGTITPVNPSPYYDFAYTYGLPAINSMAADGSGIAGNLYITCTTCHNQHHENVYSGAPKGYTGSVLKSSNIERKIFYVNGPYNPGAPYDPTHEPSTMRFCQECHFSFSSEAYGATNIGTSY